MAKVLIINSVWTSFVCGMLAVTVMLFSEESRFAPVDYHSASLQDSIKGAARTIAID